MRARARVVWWSLLYPPLLVACYPPVLTGLDPPSGPPRTLVMSQGSNLLLSEVIWDAGLPSEETLPGGFLGGYMFSVPPGAAAGNHPVNLVNSEGGSASVDFNVTAPVPYGAPRIDHVLVVSANFDGANLTPLLSVQGPNLDVGAVVQVGGADVATVAHKGLRNDLLGIDATALGNPIHHYLALLVNPGSQPAGSTLTLTVRNLDGTLSAPFQYVLPASNATLDSDGDDLLDVWETSGFDADDDGAIDVDLPALGANKYRRDILVEVDVMTALANPPTAATWTAARAMFTAAPIINPMGTDNGINLILDTGGTVPYSTFVEFDGVDSPPDSANFATLKAANFPNAKRGRVYHYCIWGYLRPNGSSGRSDIQFTPGGAVAGPGDDFIVTFDPYPAAYQTVRSQVETFNHELGHDLGQQHGGNDNNTNKPNYLSVMSYSWQLRTGGVDAWRLDNPTCAPAYYGVAGVAEPAGALPAAVGTVTDYSEGMAAPLVENTNTLNEPNGVCGQPADWNDDGDQVDVTLNADVDEDGSVNRTVTDFANWRALDFRGPRLNGDVTP